MASLRAAGHFLEKLELKSLDNPAGDEASHVVNRVFIRYSNLITRTLSFGRAPPVVSCIGLAPVLILTRFYRSCLTMSSLRCPWLRRCVYFFLCS
jgi:hypothetical protein